MFSDNIFALNQLIKFARSSFILSYRVGLNVGTFDDVSKERQRASWDLVLDGVQCDFSILDATKDCSHTLVVFCLICGVNENVFHVTYASFKIFENLGHCSLEYLRSGTDPEW